MTPEEIFGALASYLEIEYQQKTNKCKLLGSEISKTMEVMSLFEMRELEQDKEVVKNYILKPLESIENSLLYANEWNQKTKQKIKIKADKCTDKEYVVSVQDVLEKHILVFEETMNNGLDIVATEKSRVYNYLGISQKNEV